MNKKVELSKETINEMEMGVILGGQNENVESGYYCYGGDCAAGCSIGEPEKKEKK